MFKEALERAVTGTDGGIAGLLMDFEGIPLESYAKDGAALDIEVVGAEVSVVVKGPELDRTVTYLVYNGAQIDAPQ